MDHHVPIGLPSNAFHALIAHSGEAYYSDKCMDILCELIQRLDRHHVGRAIAAGEPPWLRLA